MALSMVLGLGPGHIVLHGDPAPLPQRGTAPIFGPYLLRPNSCMDQDVTWYGARPRPRRICVRWGPHAPLPKGGRATLQFSAHFYCGQTAGCIKMPLDTDVGLSPGDFVLDGDPVPSTKRGWSPPPRIFGSCLLWPNGWMDQDATWYGGRPRTWPHCVRCGLSSPSPIGADPQFSAHI